MNDFLSFLQQNVAFIYAASMGLIGLALVVWTLHRMRHFRAVFWQLRQEIIIYRTTSLSVAHLDEIVHAASTNPNPEKLLTLVENRQIENRNTMQRPHLSKSQVRHYAQLLDDIERRLPRYYWLNFFQYLSIAYAVLIGLLFLTDLWQ